MLRPWLSALFALSLVCGCATTPPSRTQPALPMANVGVYPPPHVVSDRPRVAVPAFGVSGETSENQATLGGLASDEMATLLTDWGGFRVIERAEFEQLLKTQNLAETTSPIHPIQGVDFVLVGKITNLRISEQELSHNITIECRIDLQLIGAANGQIRSTYSGDYKHTDSASAIDMSFQDAKATSPVYVTPDDKDKILRLALDDALRRTLPKFNQVLTAIAAGQSASI